MQHCIVMPLANSIWTAFYDSYASKSDSQAYKVNAVEQINRHQKLISNAPRLNGKREKNAESVWLLQMFSPFYLNLSLK